MKRFLLLGLVFVSSCVTVSQEEYNRTIGELRSRISALEERQKLLEEKNVKTEERVDNIANRLTRLSIDLESLKLKLESSNKVNTDISPVTSPVTVPTTPMPSETPTAKVEQQPKEDYQKAYESAFELYNLRRLNQAKSAFIDFIKKYPNTPLTDNAYFWLGVVYKDLGDNKKMEAVWLTLIEKCRKKELPDCNKAPSAMLQLAKYYEQSNQRNKAMELYNAIVSEYPLSTEAQIAKQKLEQR
ncbi:tetratricopeptide repeat protein [Thermocrinis minervae]|uniref:Tol-pal system protein YbgF n=1 Tax=Thermocrinis minervae TaxID=381751 RepID=A0A1M6R0C4_9AQUI|nr:tetratricopeptide repeat protein [Thermocrinis minervae]SHK25788.1 tol-pal system protein YbgF [Thermocrinis minervae]